MKKIERTTEGMRETVLSRLEMYINGMETTERMETIVKSVNAVTKTLITDLEARKLVHKINEGTDQPKALADLNLNMIVSKGNTEEPEND